MIMDNPIQEQKPDEFFPDCSVIKAGDKYYRIPTAILDYIENLEQRLESLYEDAAGENL